MNSFLFLTPQKSCLVLKPCSTQVTLQSTKQRLVLYILGSIPSTKKSLKKYNLGSTSIPRKHRTKKQGLPPYVCFVLFGPALRPPFPSRSFTPISCPRFPYARVQLSYFENGFGGLSFFSLLRTAMRFVPIALIEMRFISVSTY